MEAKKRRKTKGTVIIGRGAATVRIYPIIRKNGYPQNSVCWKEGGLRRTRCFACMDEAKMVAQQINSHFPALRADALALSTAFTPKAIS